MTNSLLAPGRELLYKWYHIGDCPSQRCQKLFQCYEREEQDRMELHRLGELKGLLARADIGEESHKQHRKQVDRLMLNLKKAKQVARIRNKYGSFVTDPVGVAKALSDHWSGISKEGGGTSTLSLYLFLRGGNDF